MRAGGEQGLLEEPIGDEKLHLPVCREVVEVDVGVAWLDPILGIGLPVANELLARRLIFTKDSSNPSSTGWERVLSDRFQAPAGAGGVVITFEFDSVDNRNNDHVGWVVDNVRITKATSGSPLSALAQEGLAGQGTVRIGVLSFPNPVRGVDATTFVAAVWRPRL